MLMNTFYDYNTTNKKTASIYSSVDKISLRVYDINEAASETYLFGASLFTHRILEQRQHLGQVLKMGNSIYRYIRC